VEFLIVMVLVLVVLYVVTIRPQRQRQQALQTMIERAAVGDDVLTNGGIYGTITQAEGDDLVVEIADGLEVHMTRRGIAAVLPPEDDEEEEDEEEDEEIDADAEAAVDEALPAAETDDEAAVRAEEEPVTSPADADAAAADRR
jgi:preprotein translocase subunit YajC